MCIRDRFHISHFYIKLNFFGLSKNSGLRNKYDKFTSYMYMNLFVTGGKGMKKSRFKKFALVGLTCIIISTSAIFALTDNFDANTKIRMQINNEWVDAQNLYIENDRTMVPLDGFIEELGLKAQSDLATNKVKIHDEMCIRDSLIL